MTAKRPPNRTQTPSRSRARVAVSLDDIRQMLRERMPELRKDYAIQTLGIFGSYVRGDRNRRSDLDLLVEFDRAPTLLQFIRLERQLSQYLGVKVDLVMKSSLRPAIGRRILREVVPV